MRARVEAGAIVGPLAVVGAGAIVGPRARLERVVVWPGARVDEPLADAVVTTRGIFKGAGT